MIAALVDLAREHLAAGRPLVTRASGHSMWPLIRDGATVTILPLAADPRVGDVVLVDAGQAGLVLHRVVAIGPAGFVVKGDARPTADGAVPREGILGRWDGPGSALVAALSRGGGRLGARLLQLARRASDRLRRG
ncbi:MAG: S24/S26 family peptidase [Myxococcota bacterium]